MEYHYKIKSSSDQYKYPDATNQLAHFIRRVGLNVGMKYGVKESGAKSEKIPGLLRKMGYTCSDLISYSDKGLVESLKAGHPVYQCGFDKESDYFIFQTHSDGHAWVVDGYRYEMLNIRICRPRRGEMDCDSERDVFYLYATTMDGEGYIMDGTSHLLQCLILTERESQLSHLNLE
ncbi:C10 family peptidase [Bacteroides fragilis]